jgi:hypothetical protein
MAEVPGWLKFVSDVAKHMDNDRKDRESAECQEQYRAGFEAARRGRDRRIQLIAEPSEYFRAWNDGYDAGSE